MSHTASAARFFRRTAALGLCLTAFALSVPAAAAQCTGTDVRPSLSAEDRAVIDARLAQIPYPAGNLWRAQRGDQTIHLIGTIHIDDPRMAGKVDQLRGLLETADHALFEMTPEEDAALKAAMAAQPDLLFMEGGSLPEMIPEAAWQEIMAALRARGVPPIVASRFKPWYVSVLLAMPPCMSQSMQEVKNGLDFRLMRAASEAGVTLSALEPWDTMFSVFGDEPVDVQIRNLLLGLETLEDSEDMLATLRAAYFDEAHAEGWEVSRWKVLQTDGMDPAESAALFDQMERDLLHVRNRAWIPVILDALEGRRQIAVAFGAGHLSGRLGVLALLEAEGFQLERLPF